MALEATLPPSDVNVPGDYFSLAGFAVTTLGRFWVTPEARITVDIFTRKLGIQRSEQRNNAWCR
jgi:hypothetical protein